MSRSQLFSSPAWRSNPRAYTDGWNRDPSGAPKGVPLIVSTTELGERPVTATFQGIDDRGESIWLYETEDGPIRIAIEGWRHRRDWTQ